MKTVSFFSKFTFICNIAFVVFVFFNLAGAHQQGSSANTALETIPFLKEVIIILGFSAIVINLLMCIVYLIIIFTKKNLPLPKWLTIVNFIFLPVQFYFFFS
jgi:hypothetical protein